MVKLKRIVPSSIVTIARVLNALLGMPVGRISMVRRARVIVPIKKNQKVGTNIFQNIVVEDVTF